MLLRERFVAAQGQIERMLKQLPASNDDQELREVTTILIELGMADDSIFALRRNELRQAEAAEEILRASRNLAVRLGSKIAQLVTAAKDESDATAIDSEQAIQTGKLLMVLFTAMKQEMEVSV